MPVLIGQPITSATDRLVQLASTNYCNLSTLDNTSVWMSSTACNQNEFALHSTIKDYFWRLSSQSARFQRSRKYCQRLQSPKRQNNREGTQSRKCESRWLIHFNVRQCQAAELKYQTCGNKGISVGHAD